MKLTALTARIRDYELMLAPGSETALWGDYIERMRQVCGILPLGDIPDDLTVPDAEADWWLAAYVTLEQTGQGPDR